MSEILLYICTVNHSYFVYLLISNKGTYLFYNDIVAMEVVVTKICKFVIVYGSNSIEAFFFYTRCQLSCTTLSQLCTFSVFFFM